MDSFRKQLVLACSTIVLVIGLGAVTGVTALRTATAQRDEMRTVDRTIALAEKLRSSLREVGASARRYMVSGDLKELQRVFAILDEIKGVRALLNARCCLVHGSVLEADIDEFERGIVESVSYFEDDPVTRLTRFEDHLARIRTPLSATFDDLVAAERSRRANLRDTRYLAQSAEWTLLFASCIGIVLAFGLCVAVLRRLGKPAHPARAL